jgi:hypothetical protein
MGWLEIFKCSVTVTVLGGAFQVAGQAIRADLIFFYSGYFKKKKSTGSGPDIKSHPSLTNIGCLVERFYLPILLFLPTRS